MNDADTSSSGSTPSHHLAAVWFADLVGYTALSETNEGEALRAVSRFQSLVRAVVQTHGGRVVKFLGDGALAEFPSTEEAVRSADALRADLARVAEAEGLGARELRIGVHVGDVAATEDGDLYGDGVNVASRIQAAADPGEVWVSEDVRRQLRQRPELRFASRGERTLKGLRSPIALYAVGIGESAPTETPSAKKPAGPATREASPASGEPAGRWTRRRAVSLLGAGVLIAVVALGASTWLRGRGPDLGEGAVLAVLPFENLSGDEATEPFVLGVHDDLLTHLSGIASLNVISRTSVMAYRGTTKSIPEIAEELGASAILEGGIQRSGDRIRMNVQLIDPETDEHLWAEQFDRTLTAENVFAIQGEIAQSVAAALRAELAPSDLADLAEPGTSSLEALEAYHAGRRAYYEGDIEVRETVATREFERAVALDSEFAEAWAGLSYARSWLVREGIERDTLPARQALDRARELDRDGFETRVASAFYQYYARRDFHRAYEEFLGVYHEAPRNATVLLGLAAVERRLGRWDDAIEHYQESIRLDPRNATTQLDLGATMGFMARYAEAIPYLERAVRISPSREDANLELFSILLWGTGDTASARTFVEDRTALRDPRIVSKWRADLALVRRDYSAARRALEAFPEEEIDASPFTGYGTYYSYAQPLLLARVAWLEGDTAAVDRYAAEILRWADASPFSRPGPDPWSYARTVHLLRALAYAYRDDVESALDEAELVPVELDRDAVDDVNILGNLVFVWIVTGEKERALDGLERLDAASLLSFRGALRLDPMYDSLRNEPRFQRLVAGP